jgi:hypothetical protein
VVFFITDYAEFLFNKLNTTFFDIILIPRETVRKKIDLNKVFLIKIMSQRSVSLTTTEVIYIDQ